LDPAVEALMASAPRPPLAMPDPALSLAERARAFRARNDERLRPAFDGAILDRSVPVCWGSVPGRVYRPRGAGEHPPVVAFCHGGGFIAGDLDSHDGLSRELAASARAVIVAVAYWPALETPFPGGLEDAYDATTWLPSAAPELGIDSRRLGVAGDSAGANLATGVAMLARAHRSLSIAFQLLLYPKLDFVNTYSSHEENRAAGIPRAVGEFFDDCYLPDRARRADPTGLAGFGRRPHRDAAGPDRLGGCRHAAR
jgi:acetyl esterase